MNKYEGLFILDGNIREEALKEQIDKIQAAIKQAGGTVTNVQKMEQRPFARVTGARESGFYVNFLFQSPPKTIAELDAKFHLDTDLVRWQFTKFEEPSPEEEKFRAARRKRNEATAVPREREYTRDRDRE